MKHKLLLASGLTFIASGGGFHHYAKRLEVEVAGGEKIPVLVAAEDMQVGTQLTAVRLGSVSVPESYLDERRVLKSDLDKVVGGQIATELKAGQALVWSDVATAEGPQRLSLVLPRGRRAYTLPSEVNPMGALLRADDEVDVLLLFGGRAEALLEKVRVIGVGRVLRGTKNSGQEESYSASDDVTLDVSLTQAQALMAAEQKGELRLVVRHPDDEGVSGPRVEERQPNVRTVARSDSREIEHVR